MIEKVDAKQLAPTVWHKPEHTFLLGCGVCPDRVTCGGLQIRASVTSCMDFCCGAPATCTNVCPKKPDYSLRVHEVHGFDLMDIEKRSPVQFPNVPDVLPLIYRSLPLQHPVDSRIVAIPFSQSFLRRGKLAIAHSRAKLNQKFRLAPEAKLVLSGVENDSRVELWWGSHGKDEVLAAMREMGILFVTIPNFSAAADVPRHDNMHGLKRIARTWAELHDARIPSAVHANCRTDYDFERFGDFLKFHDEIEAIAFEYTTGSANEECGEFFTSYLCALSEKLARPMTLVLRGGVRWMSALSRHYATIVMLDTTACMRTINRQRAIQCPDGWLRWRKSPTQRGAPIDELLSHNIEAMVAHIRARRLVPDAKLPRNPVTMPTRSKVKLEADYKSLQGSLL